MLCVCVCVLRIVASLEAEASALSSVASSQDSLHKQPKKKGIKSSIGRLFGKKEKGRLAHLAHRQVMVDPQGGHWNSQQAQCADNNASESEKLSLVNV